MVIVEKQEGNAGRETGITCNKGRNGTGDICSFMVTQTLEYFHAVVLLLLHQRKISIFLPPLSDAFINTLFL